MIKLGEEVFRDDGTCSIIASVVPTLAIIVISGTFSLNINALNYRDKYEYPKVSTFNMATDSACVNPIILFPLIEIILSPFLSRPSKHATLPLRTL